MSERSSHGDWLSLQSAVALAMWGFEWEGTLSALNDKCPLGLLKGVVPDSLTEREIYARFDKDLSADARIGVVKFRRLVKDSVVDVPSAYFVRTRGFSIQDTIFAKPRSGSFGLGRPESGNAKPDLADVIVERKEFLHWLYNTYPALRPPQPESPEEKCRTWLVAEIEKSPSSRPKPKKDFEKEARKKFAGLSGPGFDRAWKAALKNTNNTVWNRSGRPKKTP